MHWLESGCPSAQVERNQHYLIFVSAEFNPNVILKAVILKESYLDVENPCVLDRPNIQFLRFEFTPQYLRERNADVAGLCCCFQK